MRTASLLIAAAGIGQAVATFGGFGGFRGADPFSCPDNTDNKCKDKQTGGFDWSDLIPGKTDFDYSGFRFKGWQCKDDLRDRKEIDGECGPDKDDNPFFESDEDFSVDEFEVYPEFDTDLEFVYDMPGGKQCKQRSRCSSKGTKVKNTQCGGAKKVTVCHPRQPQRPKEKCRVRIPKIDFVCGPPKPGKPPKDTPTPTPEVPETTPGPAESTTAGVPGTTEEPDVPGTTISSSSPEEPTAPGSSEVPVSSSSPEEEETPVPSEPIVETITTSHMTTSTIFTTSVSTITSCEPEVPDCPGEGVVTVTIPATTTVCPVTETIVTTRSTSDSSPEEPETSVPEEPKTTVPEEPSPSATKPPVSSDVPAPPPAEEPLPCPPVVPSCLNTWLFQVGCKDNTDTACFCPDSVFVQNIFTCIYAHGDSDTVISQALIFFQGICAPHAPDNDAIVTGIDTITSVITPGPKPTVPAEYTTVIVTVTKEVPCVTDGVTISGSSTTTVIEQTAEFPNVGFQTDSQGVVGVVPVTPEPVVLPTDAPVVPTGGQGTFISVPLPTGTGGASPSGSGPVEVGAGSRAAPALGFVAAVVAGAAALL